MYLGIEIGGSKLQLGLGRGDGKLEGLLRSAVDVESGGEGIRRQIVAASSELLKQAGLEGNDVQGIGIGFGGPVDDAGATVVKSHQIEGWDDFPLRDWISEILGRPAVLGNDADVAGLAEALFGAGKGVSPVFYITIGSGIGGGLIINGEIHRGCGRGAGEIGHLRIARKTGQDIHYLKLEEIASGWSLEASSRAVGLGPLTAPQIAAAVAAGDHRARRILDTAWEALAEGICHVLALVCPRRIVIGGGVSLMGEQLLFEPLRRLVAERVFQPFAGRYDIVPAALGEEVVVHGALALARRRLSQPPQ